MKIVLTKRELQIGFTRDTGEVNRIILPYNTKFVLGDGIINQLFIEYGSKALEVVEDLKDAKNRYQGESLSGKSLISIREGGAGDLLFKTPTIKYLKEKYPDSKISIACSSSYHSIFKDHPHISKIYSHILPYEDFKTYDYFATFEGLIENNKEAELVNAYDLFSAQYGIDPNLITDKRPILSVSKKSVEFWKYLFLNNLFAKTIGYQWRASSPVRTVPFETSAEILRNLVDKGYTVFLLDSIKMKNDCNNFIRSNNLDGKVIPAYEFSDSFERMAALISLLDLYVGPDSSGTHIAAALEKPIVGLYGPFRSHVRLKYYKNATGIDVELQRCGHGCHSHTYTLCDFAYELGLKSAPCWKLLKASSVVEEIEKLYKNVYGDKK